MSRTKEEECWCFIVKQFHRKYKCISLFISLPTQRYRKVLGFIITVPVYLPLQAGEIGVSA